MAETTAPPHGDVGTHGSGGQSILSSKVARAIQVRTDTPAMKAALEALANLNQSAEAPQGGTHTGGGLSKQTQAVPVLDSRSVRVAIERDALQQALLLQNELKKLVATVQELRQGVSETAVCARRVKEAIHTAVVTEETPITTLNMHGHEGGSNEWSSDEGLSSIGATTSSSLDSAFEQELKLAAVLSDAFSHRNMARKRLEAVNAFLEKFDLSQEDSRLLDHYAFEDICIDGGAFLTPDHTVPNGMAFLSALERVRRIRVALVNTFGTSGELMTSSSETADRRGLGASSALRMMESLAQKQERSYERLYQWLQKYLHSVTSGNNPNRQDPNDFESFDEALQHPFIRSSLHTLRHIPAFYSHTLELVASSRRSEETKRFLLALTAGYNGMPPIEMKSHDPVVYVGDMLAFAFKAFSIEADVAKGLVTFTPESGKKKDVTAVDGNDSEDREQENNDRNSTAIGDDDFLEEKPLGATDLLSISMSGLVRPLKSRITQVIATLARRPDAEDAESDDGLDDDFEEEGVVVRTRITHLYEICGLLLFYVAAMEKGVQKLERTESEGSGQSRPSSSLTQDKERNPLTSCLLECLSEAARGFEATTRVYGAMLEQLSSLTGDSEASLVQSMLSLVAEVRLHSPGFSADVKCPSECSDILSVEWVTQTLVDAALVTCKTLDDTVALRQAVSSTQKAGMSVVVGEKLDEMIDEKESALVNSLVEAEVAKVLVLCGLSTVNDSYRGWKIGSEEEKALMADYPGLSQEDIESSVKEFYASLYSPPLPSLETTIKDPLLRKTARSKIASSVCQVYADIYSAVTTSEHAGYDDTSFLSHTPEQVNTLFSGY